MRISDWSSDVCSSDLFMLRSPVMLTSTVGVGVGGGALAATSSGKRTKPDIGAARLVPEAEIEAIIPPIGGMMRLVMRRGYQPSPRRSEERRVGKKFVSSCKTRWFP